MVDCYAGSLVWISALAQHINNLAVHGAKWVTSDRSQSIPQDGFSRRPTRAIRNNLELAAMYVPIAVVALTMNEHSPIVTWTATIYMVARTTFTLGYWTEIDALRSFSRLVGMICIAVLAVNLPR